MQLNITLDDTLVTMIAVQKGWKPVIEDITQSPIGDEYPIVPNPVSAKQFVENSIPKFIEETVLNEGRNLLLTEFDSIFNSVTHTIKSGTFDSLILKGDLQKIKDSVKAALP